MDTAPMGGGEIALSSDTSASEATDSAPSKYKIAVDGVDQEVDLEELKRGYGTNKAATRRFQQAAEIQKQSKQMQKESQQIIDAISSGDVEFLKKHFPKDKFIKAAEDVLLEKIEYDELPDHEKEMRQLRKELADRDAKSADESKSREEQEYQTHLASAEKEIDLDISEALAGSKLRANPLVVKLMTDFMIAPLEAALADGDSAQVKRMSAKDALGKVDAFLTGYLPGFLESMPEEQAMKYLPKKLLDHYRKSEVRAITDRQPTRRMAEGSAQQSSQASSNGRGIDAAFADMEKKFNKKRG
jgi:hemerythrin